MSGGSYDYLAFKDESDFVGFPPDKLREMAEDLAALGFAEDAAYETEELITILNQFRVRVGVRLKRLHEVWHAMEWWQSGDYRKEQFEAALAEYRGDR